MYSRHILTTALILGVAVAFGIECSNSDDNGVSVTSNASVEFVNALQQAPSIDILINDTLVESDLLYPQHSIYRELAPGQWEIQVVLSGTTSPFYIDSLVTFNDNLFYSVYVTDTLPYLKLVIMPDVLSRPDTTYANVRCINLAVKSAPVDVYTVTGDSLFAGIAGLAYQHFTNSVTIPAGPYPLQLRAAATGDTLTVGTRTLDFTGGQNYTLMILRESPGGAYVFDTVVTR
jgi:hypothetical protein